MHGLQRPTVWERNQYLAGYQHPDPVHLSRFVLTATLLVLARSGDLYSTSLWILQPGGLADETNPLTRLLGMGWQGLFLANILVTLFVLILFGYVPVVFLTSFWPDLSLYLPHMAGFN